MNSYFDIKIKFCNNSKCLKELLFCIWLRDWIKFPFYLFPTFLRIKKFVDRYAIRVILELYYHRVNFGPNSGRVTLVDILQIFLIIPKSSETLFCFQTTFLGPISRFLGKFQKKHGKLWVFLRNSKKKSKIVIKFWLKPVKFLQNIYMCENDQRL